MSVYRYVQTSFWQDDFVLDLTPEEKYFYIYLMTNTKTRQCGIYGIPKKVMELETGYNRETIDKLLLRFSEYGKILYSQENNEVMVINWVKHNWSNSITVKTRIIKELKEVKTIEFVMKYLDMVKQEGHELEGFDIPYPYPIDTLSIPNRKETETETLNKQKTETETLNKQKTETETQSDKSDMPTSFSKLARVNSDINNTNAWTNVRQMSDKCPPEIELELELEKNKDKVADKSAASSEDDTPYKQIIEMFNIITGKKLKHTSETHRKHIRARWKEGYTLDEFEHVVRVKSKQWLGDVKTEAWLTPKTLFGPKMDNYVNERLALTNQEKQLLKLQSMNIGGDYDGQRNKEHGSLFNQTLSQLEYSIRGDDEVMD